MCNSRDIKILGKTFSDAKPSRTFERSTFEIIEQLHIRQRHRSIFDIMADADYVSLISKMFNNVRSTLTIHRTPKRQPV